MRTRAFRRHQTERHMWRRLKEDWNQHYDRPNYPDRCSPSHRWMCPCFTDPKAMARFKEQPRTKMDTRLDGNPRHDLWYAGLSRLTLQERRHLNIWLEWRREAEGLAT